MGWSRRRAWLGSVVAAIVLLVSASGSLAAQRPTSTDSARTSALAGLVRDSSGRGIPLATVLVEESDIATVTDDTGHFRLPGVPAGRTRFVARRIGFEPATFEIDMPAGLTVNVNVKLPTAAYLLNKVEITAEVRDARLRAEGFYERMRKRIGKYMVPEDVEKRRGMTSVAMLVSDMPGFRVTSTPRGRGYSIGPSRGGRNCVSLFLDGVRLPRGGSLDDFTTAREVYAIELYPYPAEVPHRFTTSSNGYWCSAIVVWSKYLREPQQPDTSSARP
jgi:hypothetical protein